MKNYIDIRSCSEHFQQMVCPHKCPGGVDTSIREKVYRPGGMKNPIQVQK